MRALMNLLSFVEPGKLLPNGPLDCISMGGSVPFEEALVARLGLFKPSLARAQDFLQKSLPRYYLKDAVLDGGVSFTNAYGVPVFKYHEKDKRSVRYTYQPTQQVFRYW